MGPGEYHGRFAGVDLPAAHGADRKRLKKLRPARLIVLGEADGRYDLVREAGGDKFWLNAESPEAAGTGCRAVTTSGRARATAIPGARPTGDPLPGLDALPDADFDPTLCERFKEYRERQHPVFYVAMAGAAEVTGAYGMLFEILLKKTAIMLFSLADPAQHERVYHDAIKYSMPTIRHSRLYTSYVPRKNRVYFIESAEVRQGLYVCPDLIVAGATLSAEADHAPDLATALQSGRALLVGPRRDDPLVRAAVAAGMVAAAEDVDTLAARAMALFDAPEEAAVLGASAREWLGEQVGARARVLALLEG
ncbi:MAG TPA: 3-deoxy-D-manno-octulosonic acid transferase [Thioalkalivibrio sp.]|nr:3-deoxy-D-manno-octulosonic acid transferase [Thioalkalivibrio sp.]